MKVFLNIIGLLAGIASLIGYYTGVAIPVMPCLIVCIIFCFCSGSLVEKVIMRLLAAGGAGIGLLVSRGIFHSDPAFMVCCLWAFAIVALFGLIAVILDF